MLHQITKIFFATVVLLSSQVGYGSQYDDVRQRKMAEQHRQLDELFVQAQAQRRFVEELSCKIKAQNNQQRPTQGNQQRSNTISRGKKNITVKNDGVGLIVMNDNMLNVSIDKQNEFLNFIGFGSCVDVTVSDNVEKLYIYFDQQSYNNRARIYLSSHSKAKIFTQDDLERLTGNNEVEIIRNNYVDTDSSISYPLIISGIGVIIFYWMFLKK